MGSEQLEFFENEDTQSGKYLEFCIDSETFGIPIRFVTEIIGIQPVNAIPDTPSYMRGIINLRGRIIPVIDMRQRLKKIDTAYTDRTCIIVVETDALSVGLIVDSVSEVMSIDNKDISPVPEIKTKNSLGLLLGVGKIGSRVILLLDCERLFDQTEIEALTEVNKEI